MCVFEGYEGEWMCVFGDIKGWCRGLVGEGFMCILKVGDGCVCV